MTYGDRRFRKDFHFIFQVFGVIQEHEVCRSAVLQVQKKAFHENQSAFAQLTPDNFHLAATEEANGKPPSHPIIHSLKKHLTAI
jgi:hypothetical protein